MYVSLISDLIPLSLIKSLSAINLPSPTPL